MNHSSFEIQVDGQTPESWNAILAQFSDASVYQTWAYGAVRWGARNLSHTVLHRDGQVVAAAQLRIARLPLIPAGVAYLRWGPICQLKGSPLDPTHLLAIVEGLKEEYVRRRGLALQILPNVFTTEPRAALLQEALSRSGFEPDASLGAYKTILVDLTPSTEIIRKRLDQKWRNQLNRSEKNGLTLEASDTADAFAEFLRLYRVMWERKRFETSVDVEEFGRMQELLPGPAKHRVFLARKDGEAIAALVCSFVGETAIYLLGATNDKARELKAAYFLQWHAMLAAKEQGAHYYDLGGIDPLTNPGGHHFKSGFGGAEVTQVPPCSFSGGILGSAGMWGIGWLRRRGLRFGWRQSARPLPEGSI